MTNSKNIATLRTMALEGNNELLSILPQEAAVTALAIGSVFSEMNSQVRPPFQFNVPEGHEIEMVFSLAWEKMSRIKIWEPYRETSFIRMGAILLKAIAREDYSAEITAAEEYLRGVKVI